MVLMGIRNMERMAAAGLDAVEEHQIVNYKCVTLASYKSFVSALLSEKKKKG